VGQRPCTHLCTHAPVRPWTYRLRLLPVRPGWA